MGYNDIDYAIVVAGGTGVRPGKQAVQFISEQFGIKIPIATYWKHFAKIDSNPWPELKSITERKMQMHLQRLAYFYSLRKKMNDAIEELQEEPERQTRAILRAAKLETYIAQLESLSRIFYEDAQKEQANKPKELQLSS
jgi:hypothetical protein